MNEEIYNTYEWKGTESPIHEYIHRFNEILIKVLIDIFGSMYF